jgi:Ca2+-binding RTX toxin-like protein
MTLLDEIRGWFGNVLTGCWQSRSLRPRRGIVESLEVRALLATFVVTNLDDTGEGSLRTAISDANGSLGADTIVFESGLTGTIFLTSDEMTITESLTIIGNGIANTVIDAQLNSRIFDITSTAEDVTLDSLMLQNGRTTGDNVNLLDTTNSGGAVRSLSSGTLTISQSNISGNSTTGYGARGGGIFAKSSAVTLTNSTVSGNSTAGGFADGGGIYAYSGAVTLTNSTVSGNSTTGNGASGGGILSYSGLVTLTNSALVGNNTAGAYAFGGGIRKSSGALTLTNSTVSGNSATGGFADGGGIYTYSGVVTLTNSTVSGNSTAGDNADGGGIHTVSGEIALTGSTVSGNSTAGSFSRGGGVFANSGMVTLTNSTVSGNNTGGSNARGGGIYSRSGAVTATNSTVFGNSTAGSYADGGGISSDSGALTLTGSTVSGNSTAANNVQGGGIYARSGAVTMTNSTVSGNSTTGIGANGGGILAFFGALTLTNSTVSGNQVTGTDSDGGGVWFDDSVVIIVNSTITGNTASQTGGGMGMLADGPDKKLTIHNSIIAGNSASTNPDFTAPTTPATNLEVLNSLIGRSNGTTLIATVGTNPGANGNLIGGDTAGAAINPLLGPLAFNGGPTQTHALLTGSPAINRGNNSLLSGLTTDQRGNPVARIVGTTVDIGAYELFTISTPIVVSTTTDELDSDISAGDLSLREAIVLANSSPGVNTITFAASTNSAEFDLTLGQLEISETVTITGNGSSSTIIDAQQNSRIFDITSTAGDVTLASLTLLNGRTTGDNTSYSDTTFNGGALRSLSSGTLTISQSMISGNSTAGSYANGGGIFASSGAVTLTNSTVSGNSTGERYANGGGIGTSSGAVTLTNSTVSGNSTAGSFATGGGIYASSGTVTLTNSTVSGNGTTGSNAVGGGIYAFSGAITLTSSTVSGNSTMGSFAVGGGIGTNLGAVTLTNSTVSGNSTAGSNSRGGGVFASSGAVTLTSSTVSGNSTAGNYADGGGILASFGAVTVTNSTISGNQVTGTDSDGGGVWFDDSVVIIVNSTITGNTASRTGGGMGMLVDGPDKKLTIHNSIIAGNSASTNPDFTAPTTPATNLEVLNSLIGRSDGTTLTATVGTNPGANGNLIGGDTAGAAINPLLDPLANNGGPTQTHALLTGSPAINRGNNSLLSGLTTDQRGNPVARIAGTTVDIGAYELFTISTPIVVSTNIDALDGNISSGNLSLREAIVLANSSPGANTITFAASTNSAEFDLTLGQLEISETVTMTGNGSSITIIDAQLNSRIFNITSTAGDVTLASLMLKNGRTTGNNADFSDTTLNGGAVRSLSSGTLTISQSIISGNSTAGDIAYGGGIFASSGAVTLTNSTLSGNTTAGSFADGGGIFAGSGAVTLTNSTVFGNSTTGFIAYGGGIRTISGAITLTNSTVSGNTTAGSNANGGGIFAGSGAVTLTNSTISGNGTAGSYANGGGIFARFGAVTLTNSTVSGNQVTGTSSDGGGVWFDDSVVMIVNSTITGNSASRTGGGLATYVNATDKKLTIHNSIIANNTAASNPDFTAPANPTTNLEVRSSLIGRSDGTTLTPTVGTLPGANGNLIGGTTDGTKINPLLAPLANNGGPTQTHALLINSPAFNRGNNALAVDLTLLGNPALTTDQRGAGFARNVFGIVDMGALESTLVDSPEGTADSDAFTLTYSSTTTTGTVTVTVSTGGGPIVNLGTFPMTASLTIDGLGGTDSVRVIGTSGADTIIVSSGSGLTVNGAVLVLSNIENRTLVGDAGSDTYRFDADTALGVWGLDETNGGTDVVDLEPTSTLGVTLNLGLATSQIVNANLSLILGSATHFENATGGSLADTLNGNSLDNILAGGAGNDTYVFDTDEALGSDTINEIGGGVDTLDFNLTTTRSVAINLANPVAQLVNAGLTLTLSSGATLENIIGGLQADTLTGNSLDNILTGGAGNDTYIFDTDGALGSDVINETGSGLDTLDFSLTTTRSVAINLSNAAAQVVNAGLTLTLSSAATVENIIGGSLADTLTGNSLDNILTGGAGDDTYVFDTDEALGSDTINEAGGGIDTLDFSLTTIRTVVINLANPVAQLVNAGLTLTLSSATTLENIIGGAQADTLTGNSLDNVLTGGAGNDTYVFDTDGALGSDTINEAGGGIDTLDFSLTTTRSVSINLSNAAAQVVNAGLTLTLSSAATVENIIGGSLADTLAGNSLDNILTGGAGDDTYVFDTDEALGSDTINEVGGGLDTLDFSLTTTRSVAVSLSNAAAQVVNAGLTLTLSSAATLENIIGGSLADTLTGNSLDNILTGGAGNDTYVFDTDEALGSDTINEVGGGIDTLDFSLTTNRSVAINLSNAAAQVVNAGLTLTLSSATTVENIIGGSLADILIGNSLDNILTGGAGNDTYIFDTDEALGSDTINEVGGGLDTLDFNLTTTRSVAINLSNAAAQVVNAGLTLTLSSATTLENIIGGSLADTLTGNSLNNILTGGAGNDRYVFDTDGALGSDTINEAGGGIDTLDFSLTTTRSVAINLLNAAAQVVNAGLTLTLSSATTLENIIGGTRADTLTGNRLNNILTGGAGNDTYVFDTDGALGSDIINEAGGGLDTLDFRLTTFRSVTINLSKAAAQVVNTGLTLTLSSGSTMENVIGGAKADKLTGNRLNNILTGGLNNDTYIFDTDGALGRDTINEAGGGIDTLDFGFTTTRSVTINLSKATAQVVNAGLTLTLSSGTTIENIIGGAKADKLTGNRLNNILTGGRNNDTYIFDTDGALGRDTINEAGGGLDTLDFSLTTTRSVAINLSRAAGQVVNAGLTLTLSSSTTVENIIGGTKADTLTGNSLKNSLSGGAGNDTLNGGAGSDALAGGTGDDTYVFEVASAAESDTLTEGTNAGTDTLSFVTLTTDVLLNLGTSAPQKVHANRTLTLNAATTFENAVGGSGNDTLAGNSAANLLTGNSGHDILVGNSGDDRISGGNGRDILIGGLGRDTLLGGNDDDILVAGSTANDALFSKLNDLRTAWISPNSYGNRVLSLRTGVGASAASLKAKLNVTDDAGAIDTLTGEAATDWYFSAVNDVIEDLLATESVDAL